MFHLCLNIHWSCLLGGPINNTSALPGRCQAIIWMNDGEFTDAYMRHSASSVGCRNGEKQITDLKLKLNELISVFAVVAAGLDDMFEVMVFYK